MNNEVSNFETKLVPKTRQQTISKAILMKNLRGKEICVSTCR